MEDLPYPRLETSERINVLVIDGGARGQAIKWLLEQSERTGRIRVEPFDSGNPGKSRANLIQYASQQFIDLAIIGEEDAFETDIVYYLRGSGIAAVGPTAEEAKLETDKTYMKQVAEEYGVPTASYEIFADRKVAHDYVDTMGDVMVVKDPYLARGKGSIPCRTNADAHQAVDELFDGEHSNRGDLVIIEEYISGREHSGHISVSGDSYDIWAPAEDHKQLLPGDKGPMTGGMGAATSPVWLDNGRARRSDRYIAHVIQDIFPNLEGVVFPGYKGNNVLEFNMRPGSPEMEAYAPQIRSDFLEHLVAIVNKHLATAPLQWHDGHTVAVVGAAHGYPNSAEIVRGEEITGVEQAREIEGVQVFLGAVEVEDKILRSAGGRLVTVAARAPTLQAGLDRSLEAMDKIRVGGQPLVHRDDIGQRPT